ncbi:alpha/beta fold hydrolase [Jidongwangia harbinensis]|uniref:alpha/beta fold hydrolase n=1 Tax=Jidongwangia harbinensis TaxID=2878561 RepID=UPI001CD9CBF2|nr:alpha/beta hydrolase [Jidongwangia harbinensis]MCA2211548.1 alpha/beta hydrolase [Jidongwangia harbinensis]
MTGPVERTFRVHGDTVSAYVRGGAETLVFLHGLGCAKESALGALREPRLDRFGLCAIDLPGHGASTVPDGRAVTVEYCAEVVDAVLAEVGGTVTLVGHSLGAAVGLVSGTRFRRFISVEGNLVPADCGTVSRRIAGQPLAGFRATGFADLLAELARPDADVPPEWVRWFAGCDPTAVHQTACSLVALTDSGRLLTHYLSLRNQTYVYGDSASRPEQALFALAGTRTRGIPRSGHFPMLDNTTRFYALIADLAESEED